LRHPPDELAGLYPKELAQAVERLCVHAAEGAARTGEPVGARIGQVGRSAERVSANAAFLHELVDHELHHKNPSVGPASAIVNTVAICTPGVYLRYRQ